MLNYHILLHPEINSSKPGQKQSSAVSDLQVDPDELNLSVGITATLIDHIVIHKNKEASVSGEGALEKMRKREVTTEAKIVSKSSQMTAGLLAGYVKEKADIQKQKRDQALMKKCDEYDLLFTKVEEIRQQNLPPEKWKQINWKPC